MASFPGCTAAGSLCPKDWNDTSPACRGVNDWQTCAAQNGEGAEEDLTLPQSGPETSQEVCSSKQMPGREQAQLMAWLRLQAARESGKEPMCDKHQEPLKVFCKEDRAFLCLVCDKSKKHRTHTVLPVEEAAQDYKKEIQIRLESLKIERNTAQGWKLRQEKKTAKLLEELRVEREKIVLDFQHLHLFLQEQENLLLAHLSELEKKVQQMQEDSTKLCDAFTGLDDLISDLEENCQHPASEFLQNLKKTLSWCEKEQFHWPAESSLDLEEKLIAISLKSTTLTENLEAFKETLADELKRERTGWLNAVVGADHSQVSRPVMHLGALRMYTKGGVAEEDMSLKMLFKSLKEKPIKNNLKDSQE
ncbi:E3 ubiquitin-protein ligase TRIM7-like isoform X2 [Tiliqua scincoides]|uniref:E3 ubiquitin-protein ligase TRIM7-like isoform X2 n=1 Tax=Tiliqua scincoides TaxID=71010 RepID=UPI003462F2F1